MVSLAHELELARPAVLYANRVRVISSAYALNSMFSNAFGSMETSPEHFIDFLMHLAPNAGQIPGLLEAGRARDTLRTSTDPAERRRAQATMVNFVHPYVEAQQLTGTSLLDGTVDQDRLDELNDAARTGTLSLEAPPDLRLETIGETMRGLALGMMMGGEVLPNAMAPTKSRGEPQ